MQLFQPTRELKLAYLPRYTRYGKIKCQTACCRCSMKKKEESRNTKCLATKAEDFINYGFIKN